MRHLPQLQVRSWLWRRAEDSLHSIWVFVPSWMQPGDLPSGPWLHLRHGKAAAGQGRQGQAQPPADGSWCRSQASQHGGEVELQAVVFCYLPNIEHRQYISMPLPSVLDLTWATWCFRASSLPKIASVQLAPNDGCGLADSHHIQREQGVLHHLSLLGPAGACKHTKKTP